jgi:RNA polymerase sigma factor
MDKLLLDVTDETIIQTGALDERAVNAKQSNEETERLITDFKAFLRSRVSRYAVHADETSREEMFGTAMLAFYEAIQKYDASKGHFFPFANQVVCERLIDFNRKAYRHDGHTAPLEEDDGEHESAQSAAIAEVSIRNYEDERKRGQMVDEIEQLKAELAVWGITLATLVDQSPKHAKVREEYRKVVSLVAQAPDIIQTIQLKRYFPIKAIANISGLPPKKLERARNFLLASLFIRIGDYDYLSEYVSDRRER